MGKCLKKAIDEQKKTGHHVNHKLECKFEVHLCYYVVDCLPNGQGYYTCTKIDHMLNFLGFCCNMICDEKKSKS